MPQVRQRDALGVLTKPRLLRGLAAMRALGKVAVTDSRDAR